MKFRKCLGYGLSLFLVLSASVFAQDEDVQSTVDDRVNKMTTELKLTDSQADAIRPIIKNYVIKCEAILKEDSEEGIIDHSPVKNALKGLKEIEYQKLSQILSDDQMKKWINKEVLRASLNPDSTESVVDDDGTSLSPEGAKFKF